MCGIIGIYGDDLNVYAQDKRSYMHNALIFDQVRGEDGTGIACVGKGKKDTVTVFKKAMKGADFVELKGATKLLNRMNEFQLVIGHNRSWTRGDAIDDNCHPFQFKHITLVHNGTVTNAHTLVVGKDHKQLDVDSAHCAYAFSLEHANDVLPRLEGSYSFVWWDHDEKTLNFARNDQRPMYFAFGAGTNDQTMYFGSEAEMILLAAKRNQLKLHTDFLQTSPMIHYIFKNSKDVRSFTKRPFVKKFSQGYNYPPANNWSPHQNIGKTTNTPEANTGTKPTSTPSGGGTSSEASKTNALVSLPSRELADDGKKHITEADKVTPQQAAVMSEPLEKGNQRYERLEVLVGEYRLGLDGRGILAKAYKWVPYITGTDGSTAVKIGTMTCEIERSEVSKTAIIQVFNVQLDRWHEICKQPGAIRGVVVEIVNYRENKMGPSPVIFIGKIKENLQQKYTGIKSAQQNVDNNEETAGDPGTKADWIEIGTAHKRWVDPKVLGEILARGCYCCTSPLDASDVKDIFWVGPADDQPVCSTCSSDENTLETIAYMVNSLH